MDQIATAREAFRAAADALRRIEVLYQIHDVLRVLPDGVQRLIVTTSRSRGVGLWADPEPPTEDDYDALEEAEQQVNLRLWQEVFGRVIPQHVWQSHPQHRLAYEGAVEVLGAVLRVMTSVEPVLCDGDLQSTVFCKGQGCTEGTGAIRKVFSATVEVLRRIEALYQVHDVLRVLPDGVQRLEVVTDEDGWLAGLCMYPRPATEDDYIALKEAESRCDLPLWQEVFGEAVTRTVWACNPPEQLVRDGVMRLLMSLSDVLPLLDPELRDDFIKGCVRDFARRYPHLFTGHGLAEILDTAQGGCGV